MRVVVLAAGLLLVIIALLYIPGVFLLPEAGRDGLVTRWASLAGIAGGIAGAVFQWGTRGAWKSTLSGAILSGSIIGVIIASPGSSSALGEAIGVAAVPSLISALGVIGVLLLIPSSFRKARSRSMRPASNGPMRLPYARAARLTGGAFALVLWFFSRGVYVTQGGIRSVRWNASSERYRTSWQWLSRLASSFCQRRREYGV